MVDFGAADMRASVWHTVPGHWLGAADTALSNVAYSTFDNWDDFLIFSKQLQANDLVLLVSSRPAHASYIRQLARLP